MDQPSLDYASARDHMVDCQLRPNRIIDPRLIRAMRELPRERFVPARLQAVAYMDEDLPLGGGRVLTEPLVLAHLIQSARVREGERVLVIGAGSGYGAAVLAACGATVTALEQDEALLAIARGALPLFGPGVTLVEGPLTDGRPGPWDVIMIEGALRALPDAIAQTLNPHGGRMVAVLSQSPGLGSVNVAEPVNPGATPIQLRAQPVVDCATPALPPFRPAPAFHF